MTRSFGIDASILIRLPVIPSLRYSNSGSPVAFSSGKTARESIFLGTRCGWGPVVCEEEVCVTCRFIQTLRLTGMPNLEFGLAHYRLVVARDTTNLPACGKSARLRKTPVPRKPTQDSPLHKPNAQDGAPTERIRSRAEAFLEP